MGHTATDTSFKPLHIAVLTVSDSRSEDDDKSGHLLKDRLIRAGHFLADKRIVVDDVYALRAVVSGWIADPGIEVVICTGGTGLTGRDLTVEAIEVLPAGEMEVSAQSAHWK